jgi:hypothetical protein
LLTFDELRGRCSPSTSSGGVAHLRRAQGALLGFDGLRRVLALDRLRGVLPGTIRA